MKTTDTRIDAYIKKASLFAQPILKHLRQLIHKANPDVQETIKWGMPSFDYKGPFISIASFKQHVAFGFWKESLLIDKHNYLQKRSNQGGEAMGNFGRITSLKDLPSDSVILDFIKQAKKLNDDGVKLPARIDKVRPEIVAPDYFIKEMKRDKKTFLNWESFSPSKKRDYAEWLTEAKTEETRNKRMDQAIEWIGEGKARHWKYETKK